MPRQKHIFTYEETQLVRASYKLDGPPALQLAERLGISYCLFRSCRERGDFGTDLPRKKGGGRGHHALEADDKPDLIMGVARSEFERRRDEIKQSWSDDERNWRILYNPGVGMNKKAKTAYEAQQKLR